MTRSGTTHDINRDVERQDGERGERRERDERRGAASGEREQRAARDRRRDPSAAASDAAPRETTAPEPDATPSGDRDVPLGRLTCASLGAALVLAGGAMTIGWLVSGSTEAMAVGDQEGLGREISRLMLALATLATGGAFFVLAALIGRRSGRPVPPPHVPRGGPDTTP
jgi:hypothetical protein